MKNKYNNKITDYICVITLLFFIILLGILTQGGIFRKSFLKTVLNSSITTLIAGLGLIFVIAIGGTDISIGSLMGACGAFSVALAMLAGNWILIPASLGIGALSGLFLGLVHTKGKVISFMVSLSMLIAIRGAVSLLIGSGSYITPRFLNVLDKMPVKISFLIMVCLTAWYLLDFTAFGYQCKAVGENENAIRYNGVNVDRVKIIAFILSGLMIGVASVFTLARMGSVNNSMGVGFEMKALLTMYVAGIPVNGGFGTKIYKFVCGAFTLNLLENGLVLLDFSGPQVQLVKAVILLLIVFLMCTISNRSAGRQKTASL